MVTPEVGAQILLERQLASVAALKERGILVKINAIMLPGINEAHIETIAQRMGPLGVDLFNCMPYFPNKGSAFEHLEEPSKEAVAALRKRAGQYVKQMSHCTRCRADAVGLLGEAPSQALMETLNNCQHLSAPSASVQRIPNRPYVAVASMEGVLVNQHLGEADQLLVYGRTDGRIGLIEARRPPEPGSGNSRWEQLADLLSDCRTLLVSGIGSNPQKILGESGIEVLACEGLIDEAVGASMPAKASTIWRCAKPKRVGHRAVET